jgi:hypothetical protein
MPNILDLQIKVFEDFVRLDRTAYLAAMWVVCSDLAELYGRKAASSRDLTIESLHCVRRAYEQTLAPLEAQQLAADWRTYISHNEDWASAGLFNFWVVLEDLAGELGGGQPPRVGADRLANAATDLS